jgi:membrane protein YdbS with pleckstrin-like domain
MEYHVSRRGAALIGLWCAAPACALALLLWRTAPAVVCTLLTLWLLACFCALVPRISSMRVRVGGNHLTLRSGILFLSTKRIPLRFITGCRIWQSPLQRRTGDCVLLLLASGTSALIPGIARRDAEHLASILSHGGKLL